MNKQERVKVEMKPEEVHNSDDEEAKVDPRSRACPYLDTINRYIFKFFVVVYLKFRVC